MKYFLFILYTTLAFSQAGSLDTTFGTNGVGSYCLPQGISGYGADATFQSNGKTLQLFFDYTNPITLLRWNQNGSIDSSFGNNGLITYNNVFPFINGGYYTFKTAVQHDDKIIIMGLQQNNTFNNAYWIARLQPDGALDPSFNGTGYKDVTFGSVQDRATCVALKADGKILLGGTSGNTAQFFSVARLNSDGSYDSSFGTGGKVQILFSGSESFVESMAVQDDGKIVLGGYTVGGAKDFALARINSNGSLDTTFGVNGKVVTDLLVSYSTIIKDMLIEPDGKIIVSGFYSFEVDSRFCMVRYNPNGTMDTTFGTNGLTVDTNYYTSYFSNISRQIDGKIVTAGNTFGQDFIISRYNNNGTIDTTFGTNGYVNAIPDVGGGSVTVLVQPDNKIVAVGGSILDNNDGNQQGCLAIVRLNPGTLSAGEFEEEEVVVYPNPTADGKIFFTNSEGKFSTASVVNSLGEVVVKPFDCAQGNNSVDLSRMADGIYLLLLEGDGVRKTAKVVKE